MPRSRFTWTLLFVGSLLIGVAWILASRESEAQEPATGIAEAPAVGYRAPDFTLRTLQGESFSLEDYRGNPVVLNFWATWCPPCRAEIPFFQAAHRKFNGQVTIAGIDDGEDVATVGPFVTDMGMTYPLPLDKQSIVSRAYQVNSLPATYFIDAEGVIQHIHIGIISQGVLEDQIAQLIAN
jgi:peroxiredoxin